jgi:tetratricopeptide (TPR) repeat protein
LGTARAEISTNTPLLHTRGRPSSPNLNNLAFLYEKEGRYAEAEPLKKRALAIDEQALGPDNPTVAGMLLNVAEFYEVQGRYDEAEC